MASSSVRQDRPLVKEDSKKKLDHGDARRRDRFKERSRNIERGISAPALLVEDGKTVPTAVKAPLPLTAEEAITVGQGLGHEFCKRTYFHPTYCHHCTKMLLGIKGQGFQCSVCNFITHEKCIPDLKVPCRHIMADMIQSPVAHQWTSPRNFKKKVHCNVCRKKISSQGVICEVCKYYAHENCKVTAFNNCKHCATFAYGGYLSEDRHHWVEGNLPASARCHLCTEKCSTTDCLSGFKCGWCGITVHSGCLDTFQNKQPKCTYRDLWHMILVPKAITHRRAIAIDEAGAPTSPETPDLEEEDSKDDDKDEIDGGDKATRPCLVIDGSSSKAFQRWRKNTMHPFPLSQSVKAHELLSISLRKCGISDDPSEYYLAFIVDSSKGDEEELKPNDIPYDLPSKGYGPLKLYIRHRSSSQEDKPDETKGSLRINNYELDSNIRQVSVPVGTKTTASAIVEQALISFEMKDAVASEYCLVEISQIHGVKERVVNDTECPWEKLKNIRKSSVTMGSRQRYYLRHREGGQTTLYLGSVPKDLLKSKEKYTEYVKTLISEAPAHLVPSEMPYDKIQIGPAFPSMGGLILEFPTFELAMRISEALEETSSKATVMGLPTIYPDCISRNQEPMLIFVNGKSGGNQGVELLSAFRRHLNPHQVYDLAHGGPIPGLYAFRNVQNLRILIGGGDGTFGWVLAAITEAKQYLTCKNPPCALLPLGTGNDLARALKWGAGYTGEKVMNILRTVEDADIVHLDRWEVSFSQIKIKSVDTDDLSMVDLESEPQSNSVVMNNYCGIGLDAAIALDFHLAREEKPEKFSSRFHNKSVYLHLGLQKMISKSDTKELHKHIVVSVDGRRIDLPELEGVLFLNIQSWGAGADPWGTDTNFKPAKYDDGYLEVVGLTGVMQMGQIQSGLRTGVRLAQGKEVKVDVLSTLPIQVDGEAWPQPPSVIHIKCLPEKAAMLHGPQKKDIVFSRSMSKKDEQKLGIVQKLSEVQLNLEGGLSSRRDRSFDSPDTAQKFPKED